MEKLDGLVGEWSLILTNAWFLDSLDTEIEGAATIEWLGDAFIVMRSEFGGHPGWDWVIGYSDAREAYTLLYHDERGVSRVFDMTFGDGRWAFVREDPDFYQRIVADVGPDRIRARADMSEDQGQTWRTDLDVIFVRRA
jgi:hypothetical protein